MSPTKQSAMNRWTGHRDAEAFRALVQEHAGMVYATCNRILGNVPAAEDVTQECFETLAKATPTSRIKALGPWLHGVATKRCLVHIRNEGRRRKREANYIAGQETQTEIQWSDIYDCIDEAVAALPGELREPLVAHYLCGESHTAIARATGTPRRTITSRIQRGIDSVGDALKARGITVPSALLGSLFASNFAPAATLTSSLSAALGKIALSHSGFAISGSLLTALFSPKGASIILFVIGVGAALTLYTSPPAPTEVPDDFPPKIPVTAIAQSLPIEQKVPAPVILPADIEPTIAKSSQEPVQAAPTGAVLEGRVTYHGEPVADQTVWGVPYRGAKPVFSVRTDEQGAYRVKGLQPQELSVGTMLLFVIEEEGERLLTATERENGSGGTRGVNSSNRRIKIEGNETLTVDFKLPLSAYEFPPNGGALEGYVLLDGQIPEKASVGLWTAEFQRVKIQGSDSVDLNGYYRLDSIPEGHYFVRLYASEPEPFVSQPEKIDWWTRATILANEVTTLDLNVDRSHTGVIQGGIHGLRDGEDANVFAFQGEALIPDTYSTTWLSEVEAPLAGQVNPPFPRMHGQYRLGSLAAGRYTVVALVTLRSARNVPRYGLLDYRIVDIAEGEQATADFEFTSEDPPKIEGLLTGLHPEEGARINVYRGEIAMPVPFGRDVITPNDVLATQFNAGYDRDIKIYNLNPGTYSLWASAFVSGYTVGYRKTDWAVVTIPEDQTEPVHVELTPVVQTFKSTIRGRMLNLKPGYREVLVYAVSGSHEIPPRASPAYWQEIHRVRNSDRALESDRFMITGVDPGTYTVIAFQFPVRQSREAREAAGMSIEEFYAMTRLASAEVLVETERQEIELEMAF